MKKYDLGATCTELQFNEPFSEFLKVPFYIKRDDLSSFSLGYFGSDARKLEFILPVIAEAKVTAAVIVGTYSSVYSRMLVQMLTQYGVACHCIYIDEYEASYSYNLSIIQMCGAVTHGTQTHEYANNLISSLLEEGHTVYNSSHGGSGSVAYMGGYSLFTELQNDIVLANELSAKVYICSDSGTTQAGMLAAMNTKISEDPMINTSLPDISVVGVSLSCSADQQVLNVEANYTSFKGIAQDILPEFDPLASSDVKMSTVPYEFAPDIALARKFYKHTGIIIDPFRGLHVLSALVRDIAENPESFTGPVVFVNPTRDVIPYFKYPD